MKRRTFLSSAAATAAISTVLGSRTANACPRYQDETQKPFVPNRIAVSTYSFFTFKHGSKLTMPQCIDAARDAFGKVQT